jgi:glycosyltransferase involved in cell wall biosynthesis
MRVTIDARMMSPGRTRGIGRYIEELVRAMLDAGSDHRFTLIVRDGNQSPFHGHTSVEHVVTDVPWYGFAEQIRMLSILAKTKPDLVHVPHWNVPVMSGLPRVVTIHDLVLLEEPASAKVTTRGPFVATMKRAGYHIALRAAMGGSHRILVPTQWVADDIKRHFPSLNVPVDVTGEGMPEIDQAMWSDADANDPYLLYVGSAYPHKNLDVLLDAWKTISAESPHLSLVMAGEKDVFMGRLEDRVKKEGLGRVRFLGRVSDDELSKLYSRAVAFVFPSRNEGFGLPPLEAMAHGCPALVAQATCLPEVLGEGGVIFFQPSGADAILGAVRTVLRDPVGVRDRARKAAVALKQKHSWKRAAESTLAAYEKVRT